MKTPRIGKSEYGKIYMDYDFKKQAFVDHEGIYGDIPYEAILVWNDNAVKFKHVRLNILHTTKEELKAAYSLDTEYIQVIWGQQLVKYPKIMKLIVEGLRFLDPDFDEAALYDYEIGMD